MSLNRVVNRGNLSVCSYAYGNPVVLKRTPTTISEESTIKVKFHNWKCHKSYFNGFMI